MKLEIDKKDLMNLIGKTQNIVEKRNTMPVLVNVLLEADEGVLRVFATDLEVSLTDSVKAKVIQPGKVAVSAKSLFEIAKELSDGTIQLHKKENNWLEIKQGKYLSKIVGISADEYPVFPTSEGTGFLKIDSEVLRDMIDKTIYSVSNDETRYHLNGVFFEQKDDQRYTMVATDGHRLCLVSRQIPSSKTITQGQGVIIPRKGLHEVKKLLEALSGEFDITIEGSQLIVKKDSTTLMIRLIEGKYPNYQQFIPTKLTQKIRINREAFLTSLKRVSLLANHKSKAVTLSLTHGKMEIASNNPELGDAKEEIEVGYDGKDMKIGFNAKYITDVLNAINDEEVDFEINDQLSPGLMRPHNDTSYTCVVMPMRI
ncbi:MAG: DNA polymerase III subunit beta [Bdellovibrio sp. CG10_big_fil_rev_8_21_14_0_10_47_8]|nr:MAG: DNA polymerase III subunit beta [Bdellovibrio sp. CG10_big_fil_rev_8_21_14_0_10_47_8]